MPSSFMSWTVRAVVGVGILAVTVGCFLAPAVGTGNPPLPTVTSGVEPTLICPGDPVTVTWDGGPVDGCEEIDGAEWGSGCEDEAVATAVTVESDPTLFGADPVDAAETRGSRTVNPESDTAITVGFTRGAGDLEYSETVQVDVFDSDELQPASFPRICDTSGRGQWLELETLTGQTLPARLVVNEVCNPNPYRVSVTVLPAGTLFQLDPGDCTGELRGTRQIRLEQPIDAQATLQLLGGENCRPAGMGSEAIPGQSMPMQVRLRCEED